MGKRFEGVLFPRSSQHGLTAMEIVAKISYQACVGGRFPPLPSSATFFALSRLEHWMVIGGLHNAAGRRCANLQVRHNVLVGEVESKTGGFKLPCIVADRQASAQNALFVGGLGRKQLFASTVDLLRCVVIAKFVLLFISCVLRKRKATTSKVTTRCHCWTCANVLRGNHVNGRQHLPWMNCDVQLDALCRPKNAMNTGDLAVDLVSLLGWTVAVFAALEASAL